jgi:glycosyltransferase involved in cell wall biosynthesis
MDLFVMPSRYENFSNALLEALMCGVPFLASDVGGNRRLLAETQGGWSFSPGSADSLAEMMDKIGREPSMASDRGAFGSKKVSSSYSWELSAQRLESVFQSCLKIEREATCR